MGWGAAVGAGVSTGNQAMQGTLAGLQAMFSAKMSAEQRHFAKNMFENRYQMTVRDLANANLNPMLAIGNAGSGASVPGMFNAGGIGNFNAQDVMGNIRTGARMGEELKKLSKEAEASKELPSIAEAQKFKERGMATKAENEAALAKALTRVAEHDEVLRKLQIPFAQRTADIYRSAAGEGLRWLELVGSAGGNAARGLVPWRRPPVRNTTINRVYPNVRR